MIKITKNWLEIIGEEFQKPYFAEIQSFLDEEYSNHTIYPKMENIFNSMNYCKYEDVKVVIIGQDPYYEPEQAIGLSFAVPKGISLPPSLKNIFKEIESDLGITCENNGDLRRWAVQGVLLLNSVLTVRRGQANSHKGKGWENFTTAIIKKINEKQTPVVFLLWGGNAKAFAPLITNPIHKIFTSVHPSPLSAYAGFFGCKHFSKCNEFLKQNNLKEIDWK